MGSDGRALEGPGVSTTEIESVTFYTRPGCPFSAALRWQLGRLRIPVREVDIWADRDAAATVRGITGGNETVPTVVIGPRALVNPGAAEVQAVLAAQAPHLVSRLPVRSVPVRMLRAVVAPVLVILVWGALAFTSPSTVHHLGPVLVAASWAVAARLDAAVPVSPRLAATLATGGAALAAGAAVLLPSMGAAQFPVAEIVLAVVAGAVAGGWIAARGGAHEVSAR